MAPNAASSGSMRGSLAAVKEGGRPTLARAPGLDYEEWSMHLPHYAVLGASKRGTKEEVMSDIANTFTNPPGAEFEVRGSGYLTDGKKTKVPSERSAYSVVGVQVFRSKKSLEHVASKVQDLKRYIAAHAPTGPTSVPEFLVVTWMFKSTWSKDHTSVVHLFRRNTAISTDAPSTPFERAFKAFLEGDDKVKRNKLKFSFQIVEAPSALRRTVRLVGGERPVLIGKALTTTFHRGEHYLEVDQDVGSSFVASSLNSTILKAAAKICISTSWLIEAQEEAELPERLLGSVRWHYVDPKAAYIELDEDYNRVEAP